MPKPQRNDIRAGIFMLLSTALVIAVVIAISGTARFTQTFHTYTVRFSLADDLGGLRLGDDVRLGGLKVGSVRDIRVEPSPPSIDVVIDMPSIYPLQKGASVAIQKGLTGNANININDFGSGGTLLATDTLTGEPDAFSSLFKKLGAMQPDLQTLVANLKTASGKLNRDLDKFADTADSFTSTGISAGQTVVDLRAQIPNIIARYNQLVASAVAALDSISEFLGPAAGDFHTTVHNIARVTGDLRQSAPDMLARIKSILEKVDLAVQRAAVAMQDIKSTASNLSGATGSVRSIVQDNRSKIEGIVTGLKATSDNLKYASTEIRHAPWRLLYQPKDDEMGNLNVYDSVRQFAEGAGSLQDAADALRDAMKDPNSDPAQVRRLLQHLNDSFDKFQTVQEKLWQKIK